jgi:hypothetical protein
MGAVSDALDQISQFITTHLNENDLARSEACVAHLIIVAP